MFFNPTNHNEVWRVLQNNASKYAKRTFPYKLVDNEDEPAGDGGGGGGGAGAGAVGTGGSGKKRRRKKTVVVTMAAPPGICLLYTSPSPRDRG